MMELEMEMDPEKDEKTMGTPEDVIKTAALAALESCIIWMREVPNLTKISFKEGEAIHNMKLRFAALAMIHKEWELYRKLLVISHTLDYLNNSLAKEGKKSVQAPLHYNEVENAEKISKACAKIYDLLAKLTDKRIPLIIRYMVREEDREMFLSLAQQIGCKDFSIKEIVNAAQVLGRKNVKGKTIYQMKKFFHKNH